MSRIIRIAIASTTSKPGAVAANLEQITAFARRAASDGAHLLLTPEMSASGYGNYPEVLATAEQAGDGPIFQSLAKAARETGVVVCAGFVEQNGEAKHLAHYTIYPDGTFAVQRKHRVTKNEAPIAPAAPQLPPFGEDGTGQPANVDIHTFTVCGVTCVMVICADAGIMGLDKILAAQGVELLLLPVGAGGEREDRVDSAELQTAPGREKYARVLETVFFPGRAALDCLEHKRALAAVNLCGWDGKRHYHVGHGSITNAMGEVVGFFPGQPNLDRQKPSYAFAEIDVEEHL